ncbi:MAG: hypothetical protein PUC76_05275 [Clostridia bacterium]|nr:hypothetical protein [Clostridia bacterium]
MKKRMISVITVLCLLMVMPTMAMGRKPEEKAVTILYVDRDNHNSVIATAEFIPEGPGSYVLDNDSEVVVKGLPEGYGLLEGNYYVITVSKDGNISPDTVRFKIQHVAVSTPEPTVEPTATPVPTVEPTVTPVPTVEPTVTPVPTVEPTATPVPTVEPTVTPVPTVEPTVTPVPTVEPTVTPVPTVTPTPEATEAPKSGDPSVMFTALSAIFGAALLLKRR